MRHHFVPEFLLKPWADSAQDGKLEVFRLDIGCELTLTNDGVPPDYAKRTHEGWSRILAGLLLAYDGVHAAGWR